MNIDAKKLSHNIKKLNPAAYKTKGRLSQKFKVDLKFENQLV
jgi:hypothetical protein